MQQKKWNDGKARGTLKVKKNMPIIKRHHDTMEPIASTFELKKGDLIKQIETVMSGNTPYIFFNYTDSKGDISYGGIAIEDVEDINDGADTIKLPIHVLDWTDYADVAD